jgi:glycosyltransferase involved in cell wall biosynthesis
MKIAFVRGAYLNNFEGQNYPSGITGYSSLFPIDSRVSFPVVKLFSPADLQKIPFLSQGIKYITNRTLGDSQLLCGLEQHILNADIVHVGDPHYFYSYQAAVLKRKAKIKKLVSTWWETIPFNNESTAAKKRIKKFTMSQVDRFVCYSKKAKQCLMAEGITEDRISYISLGVDTVAFHPCEKKNEQFTILFVGRLVEEKGVLDVYSACKQLIQNKKKVLLKIMGSGPLEQKLNYSILKDGLSDYVTIEHKPYQEMPEIFQEADILCVPSKKTPTWEEQYGMVFVEALASGLPIVSYDTGAISEIVGKGGLLCCEGDIEQLTHTCELLYTDRKLWSEIGRIGRERAEKFFDAKKASLIIENLYKTL